jgi:hypothetical protein
MDSKQLKLVMSMNNGILLQESKVLYTICVNGMASLTLLYLNGVISVYVTQSYHSS